MATRREVGTLWIGGSLSWMEQICLKSFVDKGQKITLFSYEDIPNVPDGVIRRDGREIIDTDDFIKYEQKNSYALFADWFRLHMVHRCPGMIWIDTDVYCHRPMDYDSEYILGFELPGEHRVNNAVLGLPAQSDMLRAMLDFTENRYSIASFLPGKKQREMQKAAANGRPVHVSRQPWGVWGPLMVTHYVHEMGMQDHVQPLDAFYPITFRERTTFMQDANIADGMITQNTTALHLWASNKRPLGKHHGGLPPQGSYFEKLVHETRILPSLAPIKSRGNLVFDGGLIEQLDITEVNSVAELSGNARGFVLALHHKFDCDIKLVNVDENGAVMSHPQPWIEDYTGFLAKNGVDEDRIAVITEEKQLKPVDVLCNLEGFADRYPARFLELFLNKMLHSDTRLFTDIRDGSKGFRLLRQFGTNDELVAREEGGKKVSRVRFTPKPPEPADADSRWAQIATQLMGKDGWYRGGDNGHSLLYMPRSKDTLVVTFDNLDIALTKRDDRRPWGYSFIKEQGWSMLSALSGGWTWYREPWVYAQFDDLHISKFFEQFERVVFYGASMGGYAACAFSPAAPGCDVVAISPQSTLDKSVVPWETRYKTVWNRDFSGPYGDAAKVSAAAGHVSILYDPYEPLDAQHAARFTNDNVSHLRAPLMGHRLGSSLNQMGILSPIILGALNGSLNEGDFYRILRARKDSPRYQRELFRRAVHKGHTTLAKRLGAHILKKNPNRAVRLGLEALDPMTAD